jgi:hypothetical protein
MEIAVFPWFHFPYIYIYGYGTKRKRDFPLFAVNGIGKRNGTTVYICCNLKWKPKTKAQAIFLNPFTVCSSCKRKFVVCPFVDKEPKESYPFANSLNGRVQCEGGRGPRWLPQRWQQRFAVNQLGNDAQGWAISAMHEPVKSWKKKCSLLNCSSQDGGTLLLLLAAHLKETTCVGSFFFFWEL